MKFSKIIMNPPYSTNLHLDILKVAMKHTAELVNLSPILRLQVPIDPLNQEKWLDHVESIEAIPVAQAQALFCRNPTDLGIWHVFPEKTFKRSWTPFSLCGLNEPGLQELYDRVSQHDSFKNHVVVSKPLSGYCICYGHMCGLTDSHDFVYHDNIAPDGLTYREHVKNQHKNDFPRTHFRFDTWQEAENFRKYVKTDFFRKIEKLTQPGLLRIFEVLPYMPTYEHEWTEKMLENYFGGNYVN